MPRANVNDRRSLEEIYGRADFEQDAARNAMADAAVHHGLRIESAPDPEGWFNLARARHQVGEVDGQDSLFLFPDHPSSASGGADGALYGPEEDPAGAHREDYGAFIDRVLESARTADFPSPIGRGEERLKGFHGG